MPEFLTRQKAADYLNIKKSTLESWAHKGGGPVFAKFGRSVRYRLSDLESYIASQTQRNTIGNLDSQSQLTVCTEQAKPKN